MAVESIDPDEVNATEILGSAIERREDPSLLTGEGTFTDDVQPHGLTHLAILRSQHGHARIHEIDTATAENLDGVIAVFTGEDLEAELPCGWQLDDLQDPPYPILATDRVRYQGDAVAAVVAEDRYTAHEATGLIEVDYERLEAVTDPVQAVEDDTIQLHEEAPNNLAFDWEVGDADATEAAFDDADAVIELDLENQRLIPNAMEPRAAVADYESASEQLTVHMTSQNPHLHRLLFALVVGHPEHKTRVIAPEVGGGFGSKIHQYVGDALTAWCSIELGRPVKWQATRSESYQTDAHGRGHATHGEIAVESDGSIVGLRIETHADMGAYLSTFAPLIPTTLYGPVISGAYEIPAIHCRVVGTFTNRAPTDAYRGAGRPEALYAVERLIDHAARELGHDPAEFRRQNFIPPDAFPYETPVISEYDSGDYERALDVALEHVDYDELKRRQEELREEGRYLGIGLSSYIEACGVAPSQWWSDWGAAVGHWEMSVVRFKRAGTVKVHAGTSGHGQGHHTSYAQIVADKLGVDYDDIDVVEGDTDEIPEGTGTYGSRSAAVGGSAIVRSAEKVIEKGRKIAAHHLEVDDTDVEFVDGTFHVRGAPDQSVGWGDIAGAAYLTGDLPAGMEPGLEATTYYDPENYTFPFGTHIAVVEVDPETGDIDFDRYVAVDDCGNQINPKIVEGQIQGGIAQGIGQALFEHGQYDENGQLLTGSMQDYAVPKAFHIPEMESETTVTECPHNPLGVKGVGEAGTIAAPQAVVNAVIDALEPFGIEHLDMPLTPETVWAAVNDSAEVT